MSASATKTIAFHCTMCGKAETVVHTPTARAFYLEPGPPQSWVEQHFFVRVARGGLYRCVSFPFCSTGCRMELLSLPEDTMPEMVKQELERLSAPAEIP